MKNFIRENIKPLLLLPMLWCVFFLLLILTAMIPHKALEKNLQAAAKYYHTLPNCTELIDSAKTTTIHNYADALIYNIIASTDSSRPVYSTMKGTYYEDGTGIQGQSLYKAVYNNAIPNTDYERYWHGTIPFIRLLLLVTNIHGIRTVGIVLMLILLITLFTMLIRRHIFSYAAGLGAGLVLCGIYCVPFCIEYYSCFAVFLFSDILILKMKNKKLPLLPVFILNGALVCYFDFLTCEILTLCMPLLLVLVLESDTFRCSAKKALRYACFWFSAYASTWLCKWCASSIMLKKGLVDIALSQGAYRFTGDISEYTGNVSPVVASVAVNLSFLFPFSLFKTPGSILAFLFLTFFAVFCIWYLFRKKHAPGSTVIALIISLIPFVRYSLMTNHSALHPFFTYRSLLITITGITVALAMSIGFTKKKRK